jgi:hypothetical protein
MLIAQLTVRVGGEDTPLNKRWLLDVLNKGTLLRLTVPYYEVLTILNRDRVTEYLTYRGH